MKTGTLFEPRLDIHTARARGYRALKIKGFEPQGTYYFMVRYMDTYYYLESLKPKDPETDLKDLLEGVSHTIHKRDDSYIVEGFDFKISLLRTSPTSNTFPTA